MKTLIWTAAFLAAALPGAAQVSPPKGASHVFVANSSGSVTVKNNAGVTVTTLSAGYGFNSPYDIVAVPEHDMVVVSNSTDGSLTVFNGRTFAFISDVDLGAPPLLASNLRGMSVSEDASAVFVAGRHNGNPAVFRLSLPDLTPSLVGFFTDVSSGTPEDCVVVRSSAVGGAGGNAPGRVYLSVPAATTGNYLLVFNLNPPGPMGQVTLTQGPMLNINSPTRLERTPDHSVVFIGCATFDAALVQRIGRIQVGPTDVFSQPVVRTMGAAGARQVVDIAFRPDGRGYVLGFLGTAPDDIVEIDDTGAKLATVNVVPAVTPNSDRIRFDYYPPRLYIGESSGGVPDYNVHDASTQPVSGVLGFAADNGPRAFAFMQNGPVVTGVWPSGMVTTGPTARVDLVGAGFNSSSSVDFIGPGLMTPAVTFVSPERLRVDVAGLPQGLYEVRVTNPPVLTPMTFSLANYFLSINPAAPAPPYPAFTMPTPTRTEGYRMRSFPQYATAGELLSAIGAQFGGYSPSLVRVFLYEGGYVELNQVDPMMDIAGRAFWIMTRNGGDLSLDRPPVGLSLAGIPESDKVVILRPGWNLLAMPTVGSTPDRVRMFMTDVSTYYEGALAGGSVNLETAATAGTLSFPIRIVGNTYVPLVAGDDLYAGTGYWIRNNTPAEHYLVFNRTDAVLDNRPPGDVWTQYRSAGQSASAVEPPPPPGADLASDEGGSGCGATGAELLLLLALLRRRRLRA